MSGLLWILFGLAAMFFYEKLFDEKVKMGLALVCLTFGPFAVAAVLITSIVRMITK